MDNRRFTINATLSGQRLSISLPLTVSGTVNFLDVVARCNNDWDDCSVVCYLQSQRGELVRLGLDYSYDRQAYVYPASDKFTLTAGQWMIWFIGLRASGGQVLYRITSEIKTFVIEENPVYSSVEIPSSPIDEQAMAIAISAYNLALQVEQMLLTGDYKGEKGDPGEDAKIGFVQASVGSATTNPRCAVTVTEDPEIENTYNMQFAFNGIKGQKGDKGDKGDTGNTGPQGAPGRDGTDGQTIDDYVLVQDTQPTSPTNKMWLKPTASTPPVMIPTAEEFQGVEEDVNNLKSAIDALSITTIDGVTTIGEDYNEITKAQEESTETDFNNSTVNCVLKGYTLAYNGIESNANFDVLKLFVSPGDVIRQKLVSWWFWPGYTANAYWMQTYKSDGTINSREYIGFESNENYLDIRENGYTVPSNVAYVIIKIAKTYYLDQNHPKTNGLSAEIITLNDTDTTHTAFDGQDTAPDYTPPEKYYLVSEDLRISRYETYLGEVDSILETLVGGE